MADHYVAGDSKGWLLVRREPSKELTSLIEYTLVDVTKSENGRDYFTPLEGVYKDKKFSVKSGNLTAGKPAYKPAASLTFKLSTEKLTYFGGTVKAITYARNKVPVGIHPIQIPQFPHSIGRGYLAQSPYALNWFYLRNGIAMPGNDDRYLHTGSRSAGCVTVDPASWTRLYKYLILCRSGDGKTVGKINVVN
jgi:hypothetical protein